MNARAHAGTCIRTHVRTRGRSQTHANVNARKLIVAIDAWAISAWDRDCDLCVRSKTFTMYYIYIYTKLISVNFLCSLPTSFPLPLSFTHDHCLPPMIFNVYRSCQDILWNRLRNKEIEIIWKIQLKSHTSATKE